MITLENSFCCPKTDVRKSNDVNNMFLSKESNFSSKEKINEKNNSFEKNLQDKVKNIQNQKTVDDKKNLQSPQSEIKDTDSLDKKESKDLKDDIAVDKEPKDDTSNTKTEENNEIISILNAIYQLMQGKKNFDLAKDVKMNMGTEEVSKIENKYKDTLNSLLNMVLKLQNSNNVNVKDVQALLEKVQQGLDSIGQEENFLGKLMSEKSLNFEEIRQVLKNGNNNKVEKGKLKVEDLISTLMNKLKEDENGETNNNKQIVNNKFPEEITNLKPEIANSLKKEGNLSKEESFLKSLIGEEKKPEDKINSKINKIPQINGLNNILKVDTNTPVEFKENLVVNKVNILNDVVKAVKYMETNDLKNLTVKVNPKELGEIVIKLTMEAGKAKLALSATSKETYNLLNSSLGEISEKLNSTNIKIQPANINIYNEDTTFFSGQFMGQDSNENKQDETYEGKVLGKNSLGSSEEESNIVDEDYNGSLNAKV